MIPRLGIFGGMFDPVHNGHLKAARFARDSLVLDRLKLVPCASPNHRAPARASAEHRLNMLELAVTDESGIEVDPIEIRRQGISYSVQTLSALRQQGVCSQLVFILGMDSFYSLTSWYEWPRLFKLCHFFVIGRPGARADRAFSADIDLQKRRVATPEALFEAEAGNVYIATDFNHIESSTLVRRKLRDKEDVSGLLDPRVLLYIEDNRLYR